MVYHLILVAQAVSAKCGRGYNLKAAIRSVALRKDTLVWSSEEPSSSLKTFEASQILEAEQYKEVGCRMQW